MWAAECSLMHADNPPRKPYRPPSPFALTPSCSCKAHHIKLDTKAIYGLMRTAGMLPANITSFNTFRNGVAGPRVSELRVLDALVLNSDIWQKNEWIVGTLAAGAKLVKVFLAASTTCNGHADKRAFQFDPASQMGMGSDPGAIQAASGVWDKDNCLERFYGIKLTRAHARRNTQQWNDSIKLQLGLYGTQEKVLEHYFHEDRLLRSAWSKRFEAPVRGLMWCPKLDQATPGDIGKQVDRDCNAFLNLQQAGEAPWRPLELCRWKHRARVPAKGKEYPTLGFTKLREGAPKALAQQPVAHEDIPLPPWQQSDMQAMERHRQVQQAARVGQWQQHLPHEKVHGIFVPGTRCPDHARVFISGPPGHVKHTLQALKDDVCLLPPDTDSQALPLRMFDRTLLTAPTWIQLGRLQACILFQAASPDSQVSLTPGHQALLAQPHASILLPPPDSSAGKQLEEEGAGPARQCTSRSGQEQGWVDAQISVHLTPSLAPVPRPSLEAPRPPAPAPAPTAASAWPLTQPQEGVTGELPGSSLLQAVDQHNQAWVCNRSLRPSVSLQGAAQRVSLEQQRQQQRRSLEQQLRVSLDLAASGASVTTSQVLMHDLRQQQRRSLDAQREQQRRSIEQQRRSLEQRPQAPPWGRWLDRDTNPCLKFQRIGESMQRPLELCGWKDREALPPIGKEYQQGYKLVNDRLPKQAALQTMGKEYPSLGYKRGQDRPPKAHQ
ncbi:hypothetical protein QJQ45_017641 [Haematococcus lacustris]|nr:hypothetical protein QJQ45_017641 [Haematococcus lacustris]